MQFVPASVDFFIVFAESARRLTQSINYLFVHCLINNNVTFPLGEEPGENWKSRSRLDGIRVCLAETEFRRPPLLAQGVPQATRLRRERNPIIIKKNLNENLNDRIFYWYCLIHVVKILVWEHFLHCTFSKMLRKSTRGCFLFYHALVK